MSEYNVGCRLPLWVREIFDLLSKAHEESREAPTNTRDAVTVKRSIEQGRVIEDVRIVVSDKIVYHDDWNCFED